MKRLLLVLAWVCLVTPALAGELYITGGIGQTRFDATTPDGTWYQEAFPYQHTKQDFGWKAGVGYSFNESWSMEANYVNFGKVKMRGQWTDDAHYDATNHTPINVDGYAPPTVWGQGQDAFKGISLTAQRRWNAEGISPFISFGTWVGHHRIAVQLDTYERTDAQGYFTEDPSPKHDSTFSGILIGAVGGGGVCYRYVCGQVDYYRVITQSGFPISTSIVMPTVTVRLPIF